MKISYNWIKEYVRFDDTPHRLADRLTDAGFEVEELYPLLPDISGVVVAKVENVENHPDADKLSVCTVWDGTEKYQVICGAPNVTANQIVPFAKIGAELKDGFKIKKAKIRGIHSFGMICSKEELGLEESSEGIWALDKDVNLGDDFSDVLASEQDWIFDLSITPNRPDCLSMVGMAREVSAIYNTPLKIPRINVNETHPEKVENLVRIKVEDMEGCPRYSARVIKNVEIKPSPQWIQKKLTAIGVRPINNVVDITNYVLMELGQPLHAFDFEAIKGNTIAVRKSEIKEKFTALDEKERELPENTVMICDAERAVAIGGIMGGLNSEVSASTKDILLESAYFKPERISKSSKKLGLSSEASHRFERGTDPNENILNALNRAADLISQFAGGKICEGIADHYPLKIENKTIPFRPERVKKILGAQLEPAYIYEKLEALGLIIDGPNIIAPSFRVDLKKEIDLIEEVARMVTFANLPTNEYTQIGYHYQQSYQENYISNIREKLIELGLQEAFTTSMLNDRETEPFIAKGTDKIKILNPISDEMTTMRPSLLPGLLKSVAYNKNRNQFDIRFFEIGRIFTQKSGNELPDQPYQMAIMISGNRMIENWSTTSDKVDFYDIKGLLESFLRKIFLDNYHFVPYNESSYLDKAQTIALFVKDEMVGYCGKLDDKMLELFALADPVFAAEINLDLLDKHLDGERKYKEIPKFPHSEKDMALVIDNSITAQEVTSFIQEKGGKLLKKVEIFDLFSGKSIGEGKKSLAVRMRFQSPERTLKDTELDKIFKKIIKLTENEFKAKLRT
jgi:phenylalanyl-tRNA synthetase beta chain